MNALFAHGLVQRADIPIPEVIFAWAAAVALVVSFVALAALWPKPRLEDASWSPLGGFGRVVGSRAVEIACGALGVLGLVLAIWAGLAGADNSSDNITPTFVYIIVWVGFVFGSLLFGDVFSAFNPWRAIGRVAFRGRKFRAYPERLGMWPAALGLLIFTWSELVGLWGEHPRTIAIAAILYSVLTLGAMATYGPDQWARRGETFGVYFGLFSRIAIFEKRDGVVGRRPLLSGLPQLRPEAGTIGVVAVMIGSVTFDGLSQGAIWKDTLGPGLFDAFSAIGFGDTLATDLAGTVGLIAGPLLIAGFYRFGINGAVSVGGGFDARRLGPAFVHTLVPIAIVYALAHYLTAFVFQGQQFFYLASDPLGKGWDVFGTAGSAIDYNLLSQTATWYFQVGFVVLGHVAGLVLAHDRALVLYSDARQAVRSQYWMLAVMVGFTSLALWLLSQANA